MNIYTGKTVYKGIALGPIHLFKREAPIKRRKIADSRAESERLAAAVEAAKGELQALYDKAAAEVGEDSAAIFEVHRMMLDDEDFRAAVQNLIEKESVNAEYAVSVTGDNFAEMFAGMDDEYMKARASDVRDIARRLVRCLRGERGESGDDLPPSIIVADDLTPSETVQLDKSKILAFVTAHGSFNSHTSILARTMNIPALIGVPFEAGMLREGALAAVDGYRGEFIAEPDGETLASVQKRLEQELENDAGGIGLFRSEFLYIGRSAPPSEEEQYQAYKQVLQIMAGKKVVIRTLDIGADKQADYLGLEREENPALGFRAIRICLTRPEIFKPQLRALFRAARSGNLSVMYPMIASVEEVEKIRAIAREVEEELREEKIPFAVPEQGIMVETPAAAVISDELAKHVDFFSIGTNDLTQYTLAADRQNEKLEGFCNPHHEAILRLIEMTVKNGHKAGIWVGICGELGADLSLTREFIRMGVDELSVSPAMILKLRKNIVEMNAD